MRPLHLQLTFVGMATLGWTRMRPVSWFNLSDGFFLLALGLIFAVLLQGQRGVAAHAVRRSPSLLTQAAIVLLAAATLSSFASWNAGASMGQTLRLAYLTIVWFWALRAACPDADSFLYLIKGWKLMVLLTALSGFYGSIVGGDSYVQNENRQAGFAEHPNALGAALAVGLPIVLLVPPDPSKPTSARRLRMLRYGLVAVGGIVILQSGSISSAMAGVVAVGAALLARAMTTPRKGSTPGSRAARVRLRPLLIAFAGLLALAFLFSTENPVAERLSLVNTEGSVANRASRDTREELNQYALDTFDQRLVVGVGLDDESSRRDLPSDIPDDLGIHNYYLRILHEVGLFGLVAVLAMNLTAAHMGLVLAARLRDPTLRLVAAAMVGSLVAANVGAQFQPIGFVRYYWLPIGMIACLWTLARTYGLDIAPTPQAERQRPRPSRSRPRALVG